MDNNDHDAPSPNTTTIVPSRPRRGRPRGALNRATREARELARGIIRDPDYLATLFERAMSGTLGAMEPVLWAYGYGKPTDHLRISTESARDVSEMSDDELLAELSELARGVLELQHGGPRTIDVKPVPDAAPAPAPTSVPDAMDASPKGSALTQETAPIVLGTVASPEPSLTEPPPALCPFCHKSLADCAEMRINRPEVFEALHYDSPEMVEKRRTEATAEMHESLRRFGPARGY